MSNRRYDLSIANEDITQARLLYVTTSKYEGDWHSTIHTHDFSELFFVVSGKGSFIVGEQSFPVSADDMVIINANIEHTEKSLEGNPLEYVVLGVDGLSFFLNSDNDDIYSMLNYRTQRRELLMFFDTLIAEMEVRQSGYEKLCQNLLAVILILLSRSSNLGYSANSIQKANKECAKIKRYIDANFKEKVTLEDLSQMSHLSKYYLVHNFSGTYGISPISYLIEKRVEESKFLLASTNYSLSQIAQIAGFSSLSYFSQSFKRVAGLAPIDYRKQEKR